MGLREWANQHPKISAGVMGGLVAGCVGMIVVNVLANRHTFPSSPPDFYFSVDDGKSYFVASSTNYPPFQYEGQSAFRAHVFRCGGKTFVGYLERYDDATKKLLDGGHPLTADIIRFGRELKRPGDPTWTKSGDMAAETKVEMVTCPDGNTDVPDAVEP